MRRKRILNVSVALLFAFFFLHSAVFAASDSEWYENNAYLLSRNSAIESAMRHLGWSVTSFLCWLSSAVAKLYDITFNLLDITRYGRINDIITSLQPVLAALIIASLMFLGISMIVEQQKKPQLARNLILAALAVSCSLSAFNILNNMAIGFKEAMIGSSASEQAYSVVDANIIDIINLDKKGNINDLDFSSGTGVYAGAGINDSKAFALVDITETINIKDDAAGKDLHKWSDAFDDKMSKKLVVTGGAVVATDEIYDGFLSTTIGNEFYYRYKFGFIACWMQLGAFLIMIISLSYKNMRLEYELVCARILAFVHAADITSGERLKRILLFVRDTYIVLAVSILSFKLYTVFNMYVTENVDADRFLGIGGGLLKGLLSLFIAFCVIDGPNIVEKLLGMDAGLSRSLARTIGAIGVAKGVGSAAQKVGGGAASKIGKKIAAKIDEAVDREGNDSAAAVASGKTDKSGASNKGTEATEKMDKSMNEKSSDSEISKSGDSSYASFSSADNKALDNDGDFDAGHRADFTQTGTLNNNDGGAPSFMDNVGKTEKSSSQSNISKSDADKRKAYDFMEIWNNPHSAGSRDISMKNNRSKPMDFEKPGFGISNSRPISKDSLGSTFEDRGEENDDISR